MEGENDPPPALNDAGQNAAGGENGETTNYEEDRSATVALTVTEPAAASVTKADGKDGGTYTTLPAALDAAQDGDTVKLLANHTTNWRDVEAGEHATLAVVKKTLTLNLNGMTVDYLTVGEVVSDEADGILDSTNGNLTVVDNIQGDSCGKIKNLEFVKGSLAIQGGRIGDDDGSDLTCDGNSGTVTISGGTVCNVTVGDGAAVTVTGGTGHAGGWYNDGTLNITDGTFGNVKFRNNGGTIAISGGTFDTITNSDASSTIPLMPLLANGYAFYKDNAVQDSTAKTMTDVTVGAHTHVPDEHGKCACGASIIASVKTADGTERTYGSFTDALAAAVESNGSTLQLHYDVDLGDTKYGVSVDSGKFTLDLNSKTLSGKVDYQLLTVSGTADITIKNGKLVNTFSHDSPAMNRGLANAIQITGGTAVLENVEVTGGCGENGEHTDAVCLSDGNLTVANGTFTGAILVMPKTADQPPVLKITSATLHNGIGYFIWNTSNPDYDGVKALFADGSLLFDKDGNYIDITNAAYWQTDSSEEESFTATVFAYGEECSVKPHTHSFENGKCGCGVAAIVVDNNNSCYSTLQAALDAAANNASITSVTLGQDLTEDVTFNRSAAESLTLNMNAHKLEAEAGVPLTVTGGTLRIEGAGEINQNTASNANAFPAISLTGGKLVIAGDLAAQGGYDSSNGRKPAIYATDGELDLQGNVSLNGGLTITGTAKLTNPLTQGTFYVDASETGNAIAITDSEVPGGEVYKKALELLAKDHAFYRANGSLADAGGARLSRGTYTIKSHTCSYTHNETYGIAFCNCGRSHAHRDLSEEKSVLVNGICPICGYHCPHKNIGDDGVCKDCNAKMVAKVTVGETTTFTADLADALNKAANDTTIKLLANAMLPDGIYVSKTLTLDLNGHSLSGYSLNVGGLTPTGQVRTGNLTVIDSSGGNGAVGVTVRNGGTLVFDPKNDSTTLLQLEVWGGTVELYGGKILRKGLRLNNNITLGNLLPQKAGLAYYRDDTQLTQEEAASQTCDLVVKSCSHGGKNGFDKNATACPYCGAPAVAETALNLGEGNRPWRRFADLQTALDADRDGGATLKLLADVTGDYTIDGTQDTGLDLNGHSIKGTVTVKGIKGDYITTTLSNTKNTTTFSIDKVVAHKGAKLAGSKYPAVIGTLTLAEGATWKNILNDTALGYKVLNADGTHKWYARDDVNGSQLNNVIINRLPITSKTLNLKVDGKNLTGSSPKVERGTTVQLCAYCNAKDADVSIYIGETVGNSLPIYRQKKAEYKKIGSTWYYVVDLDANKIGTYDIYFTASKDGYKVTSNHKKLTVTKPNLSNAEITFPYGNEAAFNYATATGVPTFVVTYKGTELKENVDFVITRGASTYDVGPCTLTIKATDNGDYTGSKSAEWTVRPIKVAASVGDIIKTYDGTTDLPANAKITFKSADSYYTGTTLRLAKGTDYEVSNARYDSADAGQKKTVSFTIKLKNEGYVFDDGTTQKDFTLNGADFDDKTFQINKATAPMNNPAGTLNIINGTQQTYTYDFNNILPGLSKGQYGTISYGQADISLVSQSGYYYDETIVEFKKGVLTLAQFYAKDGTMTGQIGTVKVNVTTTNYENFQLKLVLNAVDQIKPEPDGTITAMPITYGDTLSKSEISGKMKDPNTGKSVSGTFTWTDGTITPNAGDYKADWTFTPDAPEYATVTGTVTIKVKPAELTVSVKASSMYYTGEEQIASIIASGESVDSTPVTFTYSDKKDGNYTSGGPTFTDAGTYTVYYKAEAANHEPATGKFTVTIDPLPIRLLSVSSISKTYDGSADVTLTADKLTFFSKTANIKLPDTALSFSDAQFTSKQADGSYLPSPEVGGGKALSFTMTLTSKNYVFEGESEGTTEVSDVFATDDANQFTITKAAAPTMQPIELTVINGLEKTYLVNLPALPTLGDNCKYGSIKYEVCNFDLIGEGGYANSMAMITSNNEFQLNVPAVESQTEGSVGTVGVKITTDNYQDMLLTVEVIAKNKIVPVRDGEVTAKPITFGQILRASTITGTMKDDGKPVEGTFEWTDPSTKPDKAGDYQAEWTFTPNAPEYATVTGTVTVKVNKADIPTKAITAPTAQENLTYTGQEQPLIIAGSVTSGGTMQYSLTEDGTYSQDIPTGTDAGAYTVWYRVIGDTNHNNTAPASVAVSIGKKPLTITGVTAASKPYDGTTNADISSVTFDGVNLNRDTDYTVIANFNDAGVGNGKNITATVTLMGQAAKNYALEQSSFLTTGSITAKQVTVSGITANGKVYDGTTDAVLDYSKVVLDGVLENDTLTVTAKGMFEKADVGEQKVTISDLTLDGNSANNYVLAESGNQTETIATITAKEVTVTPDNKSKVYEEKDPELTYIVSGVLSGETLKGITLARAEGENAGQYAITATADAGANPNYEVTFAKGTLTIEPKSIKGAKVVLGKGLTANGAEQTQTVEKVLLDDKEIPADSYTVAGNTATAPGRYTLTVTAKGNYTDSVEQIYAIAYKDTAVPSSSKPSSNNSSNDSETKKNEVAAPTPASTSKPSTITAMPQTGDTSNPTLYVVLLVASLLGLAVVFVCKKRNDK